MRDIYEKAKEVIIWLRFDQEPSTDNLAKVQQLLATDPRKDRVVSVFALDQYFQQEYPEIKWDAPFHLITKCAWFQRVWTIQEAVIARDVRVHIGGATFPWDFICGATLRFLSGFSTERALNSTLDECCTAGLRKDYAAETHVGLSMMRIVNRLRASVKDQAHSLMPSEVVHLCRHRNASLPHDMVYGVSGLFWIHTNLQGTTPLQIDYKAPYLEAYRQFTLWCLEEEGNMDVVAQLRNEGGASPWKYSMPWTSHRDYPPLTEWSSWVGRWNDSGRTNFTTSPDIHLDPQREHVNAYIPPNVRMFRIHGFDRSALPEKERASAYLPRGYQYVRDMLVVRGFVLDTFTDTFSTSEDPFEIASSWKNQIPDDSESNLVLSGEPKPSVETLEQKLSRTIELEPNCSHLWRDGKLPTPPRQGISGHWRLPFLTRRGCLAISYPYMELKKEPKVCAIYGARALFALMPKGKVPDDPSKTCYTLISGDCFIEGFEDGKSIEMAKKLGLQEEDIYIA